MKLFEVTFESDGLTVKAPGISETQIRREKLYFLAGTFDQVLAKANDLAADDRRLMGIVQILEHVSIIETRSE